MQDGNQGRGVPVKSVDVAFTVVQTIQDRGGAGVTEVATELGVAKSTAHNHLTTLERLGYLVREDDVYRVGFRFLDHGGYALTNNRWYHPVKARVSEIAQNTEELCQFAIEEHGVGVIAIREEGAHAIQTELRIGSRLKLHHFTAGKTILAAMSPERVEELIERHGLPPKTSKTITDPDKLRSELAEIREKGYAFDREEHVKGVHAIGVPLKLNDGHVLGALSIAGPPRRFSNERAIEMANHLLGVAEELTFNLRLPS
ncbi:IclR family transcriptional regulator [Haladaptatus sp. DJG-WS-42]|uniref:IclR family transcriptional regulator n=1 Tax=Haladaptatus sp. DJG-WS-42 TaxID=3120516 RepID=UPI0030D2ECF4